MKRMLLMLMFAVVAHTAYAQTSEPLLSVKRLSIAAGVEREVLRNYDEGFAWRGVLPVAYNLYTPPPGSDGYRVALTFRASQAFDANERPELFIGARVTLWSGAK